MAFLAFREARVDVAVVEVGLGGRLDATSTCVARAGAIVSIGLDHTEWLGDTLAAIAREKAGIARAGVPLVIGPLDDEAARAARGVARDARAPVVAVGRSPESDVVMQVGDDGRLVVVRADRVILPPTRVALHGAHQSVNAAVAVALLDVSGLEVAHADRVSGLETVTHPGRYETLDDRPLTLVDGAHNEAGARALARALADDTRVTARPVTLVVGATRGHDPAAFAAALREAGLVPSHVVATRARAPRSLEADTVAAGAATAFAGRVTVVAGVERAVSEARARAEGEDGVVVVTGSLYLVGEARAGFKEMPVDDALPMF